MVTTATLGEAGAQPKQARRRAGAARGRVLPPIVVAALAAVVFLVHFRPWQGGLLEDWGTALSWDTYGIDGLTQRQNLTLGRPLHMLPHFLGLAISNGGFVGMYVVLGGTAVAQMFVGSWAVRPLVRSAALRWTLGVVLALHPWWPAGSILRFVSAQVAVLAVVAGLGATVRYVRGGSPWWILLLAAAPAIGLLTYQAPAGALGLAVVLIAVWIPASAARRAVAIGTTVLVVGAVMAWSAVIAPRLAEGVYEEELLAGGLDPVRAVRSIARTILLHAPALTLMMVAVAALVVALGFIQALTPRQGWLLLGGAAVSPLAAMTYAAQPLHLNDVERVAAPVGLAVWVVAALAFTAVPSTTRWVRPLAAAVLAATIAAAGIGYSTWTFFASAQQSVLDQAAALRSDLEPHEQLVLADRSGRYGDTYLLLPPFLNQALLVEAGPGALASICTPDDVPRDQPIAAQLPIPTTPSCALLLVPGAEHVGQITTELGMMDVYEVPEPTF